MRDTDLSDWVQFLAQEPQLLEMFTSLKGGAGPQEKVSNSAIVWKSS